MLRTGFRQMTAGLLADTFLEAHVINKVNKMDHQQGDVDLSDDEVRDMAHGERLLLPWLLTL